MIEFSTVFTTGLALVALSVTLIVPLCKELGYIESKTMNILNLIMAFLILLIGSYLVYVG